MKKVCIMIGTLFFLSSCYEVLELPEGSDIEVFELSVEPGLQEFIYSSKDSAYALQDPGLTLMFNDKSLAVKAMRVRGRTTLDFRRKSYSVSLDVPLIIREQMGSEVKRLQKFKLISLSMDYTYMNNRLAFGMLEQADLMPLFYKFVEFRINGDTQGVYFLVEDPEHFSQEQGSEYILRRDYHHGIGDADYEPELYFKPIEAYVSTYKEIYNQLPDLKGEALYEFLDSRMDIKQYFRKMGIDFLLQNGDYTDEVFFYAMVQQGKIRYKIIPWDYDDIFSTKPHEVGRSWGPGTLFGERSYNTHQEVIDEIGQKMIFSIEDDLDYVIAMDSVLYTYYELELTRLMESLDDRMIANMFNRLEEELIPFYHNEEMILQSQYDNHPTSYELWQSNMQEKQSHLEERFEFMRQQLNIQN